jgi:hypothetical protein
VPERRGGSFPIHNLMTLSESEQAKQYGIAILYYFLFSEASGLDHGEFIIASFFAKIQKNSMRTYKITLLIFC